jgi:2,3-dihydroxybiphenyl 1,2-dioxygenase
MASVTALGYLGLTAPDIDKFREYAEGVIGLRAVDGLGTDDDLHLKYDERQWRICVARGDQTGADFFGWEAASPQDFAALVSQIEAAGTAVEMVDGAERGVLHLARFKDPAGFDCELFCAPKTDPNPFVSPLGVSGFATGNMGLGHAFLMVPDVGPVEAFYTEVLGLRLTDLIQMGGGKSARFYHCNPRHHTLVLMDLMPATALGHVLLEMRSLDDVGCAYDRAQDAGCTIVNHLGRHSNDKMVSFYMQSPAGVDFEVGWGGLTLDPETWVATEFSGSGDLWGHRGSMMDEILDARSDG